MNDDRTYILAELAQAFDLTKRTARYYIEKTLPPHHKKGRGKLARYGQDTYNCFHFLMLVRGRYGFGPSQVRGLLADIPQETVDRIVRGEEELAVMGVPSGPGKTGGWQTGELLRASKRATRFREQVQREPKVAQLARERAESAPGPAPQVPESAPVFAEPTADAGDEPRGTWQIVYADNKVRIQYRGELRLSHLQEEQIEVSAWVIKQALE